MTQKEIQNNTNVFDLATSLYGKLDYVFKLIEDNPALTTVEDALSAGEVIKYDETAVFLESEAVNQEAEIENSSAVVLQGQNIFDLAIQYYGGVEGVFNLLDANENLDQIVGIEITGELIQYEEQNTSLNEYFRKNKIFITTGLNTEVGIGARTFDASFDLSFN